MKTISLVCPPRLRLQDHARFMKFSITFSQIWGSIIYIYMKYKPYFSREPKEKSLEVLNRMISVANCNRRFKKSLGLGTFHVKDR